MHSIDTDDLMIFCAFHIDPYVNCSRDVIANFSEGGSADLISPDLVSKFHKLSVMNVPQKSESFSTISQAVWQWHTKNLFSTKNRVKRDIISSSDTIWSQDEPFLTHFEQYRFFLWGLSRHQGHTNKMSA